MSRSVRSTRALDAALREVLERAVAAGVTPGAAAIVGVSAAPWNAPGVTSAFVRTCLAVGRTSPWAYGREASIRTPYDLASLTKALSTTLVCAHALATGKVTLDETPWPRWPGVSVRHVLQHRAGLPAWRPFFEDARAAAAAGTEAGRAAVLSACLAELPEALAGTATRYSDLGFIALGALLEERCGARLDALFAPLAVQVFGKTGLRFVSLTGCGYHPRYPEVAPTEACTWRGRTLQGQVHDDNAFAMGGVAGHAGLFGSALDVAAACAALLRVLARVRSGGTGEALDDWLSALLWAPGERALGFDRASPEGTTGGALSERALGHLGFTGTSLWIDPATTVPGGATFSSYYVLLTNRVHPSRAQEGIRELRVDFHRAARAWVEAKAEAALRPRRTRATNAVGAGSRRNSRAPAERRGSDDVGASRAT